MRRTGATLTATMALLGALVGAAAVQSGPVEASTVGPCQSLLIPSATTTPALGTGLDVATDGSGNIYVADPNNDALYRFDAAGNETLKIDTTATAPPMAFPNTIAADSSGNIYSADTTSQRVYRFDATGAQTLAFPFSNGTPDLVGPGGLDADDSGNVYLADQFLNRLFRFDSTGAQTLVIEATDATPNLQAAPSIAADELGNIYTIDQFSERIYRFDASGTQTLAFPGSNGTPGPVSPIDVAVDDGGTAIGLADSQGGTHRFDGTGTQTLFISSTLPEPDFSQPGQVAIDDDYVYVADQSAANVYRFAAGGGSVTVRTESEYRAALSCLAADAGGPHTIELLDDIVLAGATAPAYNSAAALTIDGNGHTLDGGGNSRTLDRDGNGMTTIRNIELRNGSDGAGNGGAVAADGPVLVEDAVVADNTGGAVRSSAPITIRDSTFLGNSANVGGGQVFADGGVTVTNSTFADGAGQAIRNETSGAIILDHVTLSGDVGSGGTLIGAFAGPLDAAASVLVTPNDVGEVNCNATSVSGGHNWSDDESCGFTGTGDTENGADPGLGPARDNGSPPTMFPLLGSPLVDAIPNAACDPTLTADQRGIDRPFGGGCDIGAIEAVFPAHDRTDVSPFYEPTVRWVTSEVNTPQILSGFPDGTFGQSLNITRGQAARLYYNGAGAPDVSGLPAHGFTDSTAFFEDAIRFAKANGIFDGFPDNTFRPNDPINRGNFIRSLYGFAGSQDVSGLPAHPFTDVSPFYEDAVRWAKGRGLADGFPDNTFRQNDNINRGNASRTFYNTAQTPGAWDGPTTAPANMLFRPNLT